MATKVIMPKQGLQMTEGTILEWFKQEGDSVNEGDPLFEMETDKLTIEIDAPAGGHILKIFNSVGDVVPITETIAVIGESGEDISEIIAEKEGAEQQSPVSGVNEAASAAVPNLTAVTADGRDTQRKFASPRAKMRAGEKGLDIEGIAGSGPDGLVIERDVLSAQTVSAAVTPLAKRIAQQQGVDLSKVGGSGPRGKIYSHDLEGSQDASADSIIRKPLKGMRKVIAERMRSSLDTAAQATHNVDVEMTEAVRLRAMLKEAGIKVSYNDIILKTAAAALEQMPALNCSLQGDEILSYRDINIGMAVALEEGLIVPVMRDVVHKNLEEINSESRELGEKAKSGKLMPEELNGAVFTVSNLGMYGLDRFTAIINEPESGILAVGAIKDKPVAVDGKLEIRPVCSLTLTYDHRVIDGAPAAEFLMLIKSILENPYRLI